MTSKNLKWKKYSFLQFIFSCVTLMFWLTKNLFIFHEERMCVKIKRYDHLRIYEFLSLLKFKFKYGWCRIATLGVCCFSFENICWACREILHMFMAASGSAKANGRDREPITCLGQVFKYKLSCFDDMRAFIYVDPHPHLELLLLPVDTPCFVYKSLEAVSF